MNRLRSAAALAIAVAALIAPPGLFGGGAAHADAKSPAQALRDSFDLWAQQVNVLRVDIDVLKKSFLSRYECPPATPNKDSPHAKLDEFQQRRFALAQTGNHIDELRTLYGKAGEGQVYAGLTSGPIYITDEEWKAASDMLKAIGPAIGEAKGDLAARPRTDAECYPGSDPIKTITVTAPSAPPGAVVNATVSATTFSGKRVNITTLVVNGVDAIGSLTNVGAGAPAPFTFKIAQTRRQGPFALNVRVTGTPVVAAGAPTPPPSTATTFFSYDVMNVAPVIESAPAGPSAEPGDALVVDGEITLVDQNADDNNVDEVMAMLVGFGGHPAGLETLPGEAFKSFSTATRLSHDPATGRYVFKVSRSATARSPHMHGVFQTTVRARDRRGAEGASPIDFTVKNVQPEASMTIAPGKFFHSGDNKPVTLTGYVRDANGANDIETISIDAQDAGGGLYTKANGGLALVKTGDGSGHTFKTKPESFKHTDVENQHKIISLATDNGAPETGAPATTTDFSGLIFVGNETPTMTAYGYVQNAGFGESKRVCPGELLFIGADSKDAEDDKLKVIATIMPGGAKTQLFQDYSGATYLGAIAAPQAPGQYTIRFEATETDTLKKKFIIKTIELTVDPCDKNQPRQASGVMPDGGVTVQLGGAAGAIVKLAPQQDPALPTDPVPDVTSIAGATALLDIASFYQQLAEAFGFTPDPNLTLLALEKLADRKNLEESLGPKRALMDSTTGPDGTCGFGPGLGASLDFGPLPPIDWKNLINEEAAEEYGVSDWRFGWEDRFSFSDWFDHEFEPSLSAPAVDPKAALAAEKARLEGQAKAYEDKIATYQTILTDFSNQLQTARDNEDAGEIKRLAAIVADVNATMDALNVALTPIYEQLTTLEAPKAAEIDARRAALGQLINEMAGEAIAERFGWDESLQNAKTNVTWGSRWLLTGSRMQYETDRTTRMADRELAAAEEKLKAVNTLLETAAPGSVDYQILTGWKTMYEGQRDGAQAMLDANATLTGVGYGVDVVLLLSGGKLVQLGERAVVAGATRAFSAQTAERIIVNTTQRGLIDLTRGALGRGGAQAAGAEAGASSGLAGSSSEALTESMFGQAGAGTSSEALTAGFSGQAAKAGAGAAAAAGDDLARWLNPFAEAPAINSFDDAWQVFEAGRNAVGAQIPWRMRYASPEWVNAWLRFAERYADDVAGGADDFLAASSDEALRFGQELEAGVGDIWERVLGQRTQQLLEGWSAPAASGVENAAGGVAAGEVSSSMLGGSTFFSMAPFAFYLFYQQDAYGAEPAQATLDSNGAGAISLPSDLRGASAMIKLGESSWNSFTIRGSGGPPLVSLDGAFYGSQDFGGVRYDTYLYQQGEEDYWDAALRYAGEFGGMRISQNSCRIKEFAPAGDWRRAPLGVAPSQPIGSAAISLREARP